MPHYLFLTGRMAQDNLQKQLQQLSSTAAPAKTFTWEVVNVGVKVAALMTESLLTKRLPELLSHSETPDKIFVPGLFGGETKALSETFSLPFEKGPKDLRDLPEFFGGPATVPDFTKHSCLIFAEIVDAPDLTVDGIIARARYYQQSGADVIDIGGLPGREFPHLSDAITSLKAEGFKVSIDSADLEELRTGAKAGADYLLSLNETTLSLADETDAIPILVPTTPEDMESLYRAIDIMEKTSKAIVAELGVNAVLTTEVSDHACRAVLETDLLRRTMAAAYNDNAIPKHYHKGALALHERKPFPYSRDEIAELAKAIKERNFRIRVSTDGVHLFNRDLYITDVDPFKFMQKLDLADDWTHAFYLGVELARAQISWQLGKRYLQDNDLDWGVADRTAISEWVSDD